MRVLCVLFVLLTSSASAQWLHYPDSSTPRTKDGKPNLSAPTPRLNGKPDLSGVWQIEQTPISELKRAIPAEALEQQIDLSSASSKYLFSLMWDFKPEDDPSLPEAQALVKQRADPFGIFRQLAAFPEACRTRI